MIRRLFSVLALSVVLLGAVATLGVQAQTSAIGPVATVSEINPWILGLGVACVVLAVLVVLARNGHLGGASATVNKVSTQAANAGLSEGHALAVKLAGILETLAHKIATSSAPAPLPVPDLPKATPATASSSAPSFAVPPHLLG